MQDWLDEKGNYIDYSVTIGENFQMGFNNVIGMPGFGFERDQVDFVYPLKRKEHNYGVVIGDNVELDSNIVIERGRHRDTIIGEGTKLDSFTHVGHNAIIGKDCLIIGAKIGGSCEIGEKCFIGFGAIIKDHVKIGNSATVGMGAVVIHDVGDNEVIYGNPARSRQILGFAE